MLLKFYKLCMFWYKLNSLEIIFRKVECEAMYDIFGELFYGRYWAKDVQSKEFLLFSRLALAVQLIWSWKSAILKFFLYLYCLDFL